MAATAPDQWSAFTRTQQFARPCLSRDVLPQRLAGVCIKSPHLISFGGCIGCVRRNEYDTVRAFSGNIDVLHVEWLGADRSVNRVVANNPEASPDFLYG